MSASARERVWWPKDFDATQDTDKLPSDILSLIRDELIEWWEVDEWLADHPNEPKTEDEWDKENDFIRSVGGYSNGRVTEFIQEYPHLYKNELLRLPCTCCMRGSYRWNHADYKGEIPNHLKPIHTMLRGQAYKDFVRFHRAECNVYQASMVLIREYLDNKRGEQARAGYSV